MATNGNDHERLAAAIAAALAPEFANLGLRIDAVSENVRAVSENVRVLGDKIEHNTTVLFGRAGDANVRLDDHERRIAELERQR